MTSLPEWASELISPLDAKLGLVIEELSAERVVATIPVEGNQQPFGLLHGGASAVLVETLASLGALAHGRPSGKVGVGIDLNVTHLRAVHTGLVRGTATALTLTSSMACYAVELVDEQGQVTAVGRLTCRMITTRK